MHRLREIEHQWIHMHDGVRLAARIWLPQTAETNPVAAILEYIPYRKRDMVRIRDERNHPCFAQNGYASIRVDMRGSGDSEGLMPDMYSNDELDDAIKVIEWIADQPWCNGRIGMMGTSWGGTSSLQAANRKPTALKAVIAVCATNNRFDDDIHHMGGCLLTDSIEWGATLPAILASPPDPETVGKCWKEIWQHRLEHLQFPLEQWIAHETCDDYWRHASVNKSPTSFTCPVLMIGGWSDRYSNTVMNFIADAPANTWGIVGPWGHHYPDQANPGPGINFQDEALRWWDYWLRDTDNGVSQEPRLKVWMQEYLEPHNSALTRPGYWIAENIWPATNIGEYKLYDNGGSLNESRNQTRRSPTYTLPVPDDLSIGRTAGDTGYFGRFGGLPLDQRDDDSNSLVFETEPLLQPLEVLGRVKLSAGFVKQENLATLVVRLNDVHPDGSVARINLAVRNLVLDANGEPLADLTNHDAERSEKQVLVLEFPNTAYRFAAGHRIRLAISSTYWPIVWPSPKPAGLALTRNSLELSLPVRTPSGQRNPYIFPALAKPTKPSGYRVLSAPELQREIERTGDQSIQSIAWHQPLHRVFFPPINLEFGFETEAEHRIDLTDQSSASSRFRHTLHFQREGWSVVVTCKVVLTASETHYRIAGDIQVSENGQRIFSRHWNPTLKRQYA